jgi:hypothetical protein
MSALGQKQTFAVQQAMSALLPIAIAKARKVMSALLPKADMCSAVAHVRFGPIADMCHPLNLGSAAYFEATIRTPPILRS